MTKKQGEIRLDLKNYADIRPPTPIQDQRSSPSLLIRLFKGIWDIVRIIDIIPPWIKISSQAYKYYYYVYNKISLENTLFLIVSITLIVYTNPNVITFTNVHWILPLLLVMYPIYLIGYLLVKYTLRELW